MTSILVWKRKLGLLILLQIFLSTTCEGIVEQNDFCPYYEKVEEGILQVKDSLQGATITAALSGASNATNPIISSIILNEIARRGHFNVRYVRTEGPNADLNQTWTDILDRDTSDFDLACGSWERRFFRLDMGLVFAEEWYNADTIMVRKTVKIDDSYHFWAFTKPFTPWLWVLIVLIIAFTGAVYYILDFMKCTEIGTNTDTNFLGSIFFSFHAFTGHCNFSAKSYASQVLTTSMCFLYLILISAYTANLVNFFIVPIPQEIILNNIIDAIRYRQKICAARAFPYTESLQTRYPYVEIDTRDTEEEVLMAVSEEECQVGLVLVDQWHTFKSDDKYNKACDLEWVGKQVDSVPAGFAMKDAPITCTSLLVNVLNYHMLSMREEGVLDAMWLSYRNTIAEASCAYVKVKEKSANTKTTQIDVLTMSGAFAFHLCFVAIAIIIALHEYFYQPDEVKKKIKSDIYASFEEAMKSTRASLFEGGINDQGQQMEEEEMEDMRKKSFLVVQELRSKFDEDDLLSLKIRHQLILFDKIELLTNFLRSNPSLPQSRIDFITEFFSNEYQQQREEMKSLRTQVLGEKKKKNSKTD